jgi:hypothetical protein
MEERETTSLGVKVFRFTATPRTMRSVRTNDNPRKSGRISQRRWINRAYRFYAAHARALVAIQMGAIAAGRLS